MRKHHTIPLKDVADEAGDRLAVKPFVQQDILPHDHDCFELAYVTGGSAEHTLNGVTETVREGDYFFIDYGSSHGYRDCRDFMLINCLFVAEIIDDALAGRRSFEELLRVCLIRYHRQYLGKTPANRIFHDGDGRVLWLLRGMQDEYVQKDTGYREIFRGRLLEILILTMRQVVKEQPDRPESPVGKKRSGQGAESDMVCEAVRFLETHYESRAVLQSFCREYHYSLPYVSRKFKQETGMTALEYLQKIRIRKCCELLAGSRLSVQAAAQSVGYEDMKFFNKVFRRMLGMSPREYRNTVMKTV